MHFGAPMLGAYTFTMFMSSWWILPLHIMKCPLSFLMAFFWTSIFVRYKYCYPGFFFPVHFLGIFVSNPSLSVCVGLLFWGGSLVGSICAGHVPYLFSYHVFWLEHLIHLHLRLLLIGTSSLLFYWLCPCVPLSLALFLSLLKTVHLAYLAVLFWWGIFFQPSFIWETPYFALYFNWDHCWLQ